MPRKGENIYKRKDGRWEGRFIKSRSAQGKAQYDYVYSKTYAGVKKKLLERKTQVTPTKTNAKSPDVSYQDILIPQWVTESQTLLYGIKGNKLRQKDSKQNKVIEGRRLSLLEHLCGVQNGELFSPII